MKEHPSCHWPIFQGEELDDNKPITIYNLPGSNIGSCRPVKKPNQPWDSGVVSFWNQCLKYKNIIRTNGN